MRFFWRSTHSVCSARRSASSCASSSRAWPLDLFDFVAAAMQIRDQAARFARFGRKAVCGVLDHSLGQAQPPRDFDAARRARHADEQAVSRAQDALRRTPSRRSRFRAWSRRRPSGGRDAWWPASAQRRARNSSSSATASAAPSSGAVPVPISSTSTSERSVATSSIDFKFSMCAENVERSAAMDCSSPISASTRSKIGNSARSAATGMPDCAESAARPTVFSADRLAARVRPADHHHGFFAAQRERQRHGFAALRAQAWLRARDCAPIRGAVNFPHVNSGMHASNSRANRPRAKTESRCAMACRSRFERPALRTHAAQSALRECARSPPSLRRASCTRRLFRSMASSGSTKTVWPVALAA